MIEHLLLLIQWENYGHLLLILLISVLVVSITVYEVYFKEKIIEGNILRNLTRRFTRAANRAADAAANAAKKAANAAKKAAKKAAEVALKALKKAVNDTISKVGDLFEQLFKDMLKPVDDLFDSMTSDLKKMNERLKILPKSMNDILADVVDELKTALSAMKKVIMAPMAGIDDMITNFKRMMCFFETIPGRVNNIMAGMDNTFQGIEEQYNLLLKAAALGTKETNRLLNYSVVFINMYFKCAVKFITNLYKCLFYYMVDAFGRLLFLPLKLILFVFSKFINFDPVAIETKIWKGLEVIDEIVFSIMQFHIIYFPASIRKDCYTCVTLKPKVVRDQGIVVNQTFKKDMPNLVNGSIKGVGIAKIKRGKRQFEEASAMPGSRPPEQVK
jgi:hypothetical protein